MLPSFKSSSYGPVVILFLMFFSVVTEQAFAKNVMIFAPHPDDEALMASGVIYSALANGDTVTVVVVTNGDAGATSVGYTRENESVAAMGLLGLKESSVIFLGYGSAGPGRGSLMDIYQSQSATAIFTSPAGQTHTYANRGLGSIDFHSYLFGLPGDYNRQTVHNDIKSVLTLFSPDDVYTTSNYDNHPEHQATYLFVVEVLAELARQGSLSLPRLHETVIHQPCANCDPNTTWPGGFTPTVPYSKPEFLDYTPLSWGAIESIPVPTQMQSSDPTVNLKYQVINQYQSQFPSASGLFSYAKSNEFFWTKDFHTNLALSATVSVSSENASTGQLGIKAIDAIVDGYSALTLPAPIGPGDYTKEWATVGQLGGAWIKLTWNSPVTVSKVVLHDRRNPVDNVLAGTLLFSDGSSVPVGTLPNNAAGLEIAFPSRIVTWVQFRVDSAYGVNTGLAEIEIYGTSTSSQVTLNGITLNPSSLLGGSPSQATVTLSGAAPAAGATVTLSSGNTSVATVPPSVTVSPGSTGTSLTVTTNPVTVNSSLTIAASYGGVTKSAVLTVTPPAPTNPPPSQTTNLASSASVSVSSENAATGQLGIKAIDGIVDGYPGDYTKEWATLGQLAGAWIKLTWNSAVSVSKVVLHDRPNVVDNILGGTLTFSDGSSLSVGALPNDGTGLAVMFSSRTVTWLQFRVDSAVGKNIGLAEIEVF